MEVLLLWTLLQLEEVGKGMGPRVEHHLRAVQSAARGMSLDPILAPMPEEETEEGTLDGGD